MMIDLSRQAGGVKTVHVTSLEGDHLEASSKWSKSNLTPAPIPGIMSPVPPSTQASPLRPDNSHGDRQAAEAKWMELQMKKPCAYMATIDLEYEIQP